MDASSRLRYGHYPRPPVNRKHADRARAGHTLFTGKLVIIWCSLVGISLAIIILVLRSGIYLRKFDPKNLSAKLDCTGNFADTGFSPNEIFGSRPEICRDFEPIKEAIGVSRDNERSEYTLKPAPDAFYIRCRNTAFTFNNYLSVLSVARHVRHIFIYLSHQPVIDKSTYYTWLAEMCSKNINVTLLQMSKEEIAFCCTDIRPRPECLKNILRDREGMFLTEDVLFIARPRDNVSSHLGSNASSGLVIVSSKPTKNAPSKARSSRSETVSYTCADAMLAQEKSILNGSQCCLNLQPEMYPKNIWTMKTRIGGYLRELMYHSPKMKYSTPSSENIAPNIAHSIWMGGREIDFLFYLGILSLIFIAKTNSVYIHGDVPPTGTYWHRLRSTNRVTFRSFDTQEVGYEEHDQKFHILHHYGGVYTDSNVIFLRPLNQDMRRFDAVASNLVGRHPYPNNICSAVLVGKPGAKVWRSMEAYSELYPNSTLSTNQMLYKIKERHPWCIHIDNRLSVSCTQECLPLWRLSAKLGHQTTMKETLRKACTIHFPHEKYVPLAFKDENYLLNKTNHSMYADIGRSILKKAGMIN